METRLFIIAIIPSIAIGLAIYLKDRYDREPWRLLFKIFILGGLSIIPTLILERVLLSLNIFQGILEIAYISFVVAGFSEEFIKREVVLRKAYKHKEFNEKLDGIVYSVFAALGFATVENIMYVVFRFSSQPLVGLYRGIFSVPAHILFSITMGYYLSLAKFSAAPALKKRYLLRSLWIPVLFHGIFNFILMSKINILMVLFIPFVLLLWGINLRRLNSYVLESKEDFSKKDRKDL